MDFIQQMRCFEKLSAANLTPNAIAIYWKLFMIDNNTGWKEWFTVSDYWLGLAVGISRSETIVKAINLLKQRGFIDFERGTKRNIPTKYKIIELSTRTILPHENSAKDSVKHSAKDSPKDSAKHSPKHSAKDSGNIKQETQTKTETETKHSTPARAKFIPPTLEEVNQYVLERGLHVSAKDFFDYFDAGNWIDSKGQHVQNWKQKILTWEKFHKPEPQKKSRLQENMEAAERAIAYFERGEAL